MANIHTYRFVDRPVAAFEDRRHAGVALTDFISPEPSNTAMVLCLPRGGVPVGAPLAERLGVRPVPVPVRKLPIPSSPEMGFGAVTLDGTRVLNDAVVEGFGITQNEIESVTEEVLGEVRRRAKEYSGTVEPPPVKDKDVYIVDDGLATGYSMIAAAGMILSLGPRSLTLAVPVSPVRSLHAVESYFRTMYCLYAQTSGSFAVASFYQSFPDLTDDEVRYILRRSRSPNL